MRYIGFILILFSSYLSIQGIEKDVYGKEQETLKVYVKNQLEAKYDIALTNAITIASNYYVIEALLLIIVNLHIGLLSFMSSMTSEEHHHIIIFA